MSQNSKKFIAMVALLGATAQAGIHIPILHSDKGTRNTGASSGTLTNTLTATEVKVNKKHMLGTTYKNWGRWSEENACNGFKGTFEGNTVTFHVEAKGGSGHYRHILTVMFDPKAYFLGPKESEQVQLMNTGNSVDFKLTIPSLKESAPYVQQSIQMITEDNKGHTTSSSMIFTVSRPVILTPSTDPAIMAQNCFDRETPQVGIAGVQSNGTNNVSQMQIHQTVEQLWTNAKGKQWGVYLQPQAFGISLIAADVSFFTQTSKTVGETVDVVTEYNMESGDYMQVYSQKTRYVTYYDARLVDACGNQTLAPGAYAFQWWGIAFPVRQLNPGSAMPPSIETVGAPAMNTCPAQFNGDHKGMEQNFFETKS